MFINTYQFSHRKFELFRLASFGIIVVNLEFKDFKELKNQFIISLIMNLFC